MKKIIITLILGILVFPSVTLAAWWNPLTWGKPERQAPQPTSEQAEALRERDAAGLPGVKEQANNTATGTAPQNSTTRKDIKDEVRKVIPEPASPSRPSDMPVFDSRIEALEYENALLRKQLSDMKDMYNGCIRGVNQSSSMPGNNGSLPPSQPKYPINKTEPITR